MDGNRAQFANNLQELHGNFSEWRSTGAAVSINHLRKRNKRTTSWYGFSRYRNAIEKE